MTYGNGTVLHNSYDLLDRPVSVWYNNDSNTGFRYLYTKQGGLSLVRDLINNLRTKYTYDLSGRLVAVRRNVNVEHEDYPLYASQKYRYEDKTNRVISTVSEIPGSSITTQYQYGNATQGQIIDAVYAVKQNNTNHIGYAYDGLGRMTTRTLSVPNKSYTYSYTPGGHGTNSTTTQVSSVTSGTDTTGYTYDSVGNITEIKENGVTVASYAYDTLNQLTSASHNGTSYSYTYDNNGNITSKTVGGVTTNYSYNDSSWADLLTGYGTDTITYDTIGNPLNYRDGYSFTWQRGRQLAGYTKGTDTASYTYDESGIRLSKTVNGNTTTFYFVDGVLLGQKFSDNKILQYLYDDNGTKYGFIYDGTTYFYDLNLQGDVIGIIDTSGNTVVSYTYDPWGKVLSVTGTLASTIGQINPIRYRGYYYDNDTGFYYLQSRYYDPETGRFINADTILDTGANILGNNMFVYAANNPTNNSDYNGHWIIKNAIKWVAKNIVKPVVKAVKKTMSKANLTYSTGLNVSGTPSAFIFNGQIGLSLDTKGNVAIQASAGGGVTGGNPSISITNYRSITNAPSINKLDGECFQAGGSIAVPVEGVPLAAGGDLMFMPNNKQSMGYFGLTCNGGFGTPGGELHIEWGKTVTIRNTVFNIYDVAQNVYIKIMEW